MRKLFLAIVIVFATACASNPPPPTPAPAPEIAPPPPEPPPPARASGMLMPIAVGQFRPLVAAVTTAGTCATLRTTNLPAGHKAQAMVWNTRARKVVRSVYVKYDAAGTAYDYSDTRTDPAGTGPDPAQTAIAINLVEKTGTLRNSPGNGAPMEWYRTSGPELLTSTVLGVPRDVIAKIARQCKR